MTIDIGNFALLAAWVLSLWAVISGFYGAIKKQAFASSSALLAIHWSAVFSCISLLVLIWAFVTHEYRYLYVWQHSNNAMHPMYLVSAVWGGMDGSMLLWACLVAIYGSIAVYRARWFSQLLVWAAPVLATASLFFLSVVSFLTNPFRLVPGTPVLNDGNGLNPLLQNPSMMIHPPLLYLGFTGFVIPFAFSLAALFSANLSPLWIKVTRRWTLIAWSFLSAGIILGGNWAYIELGWGGFWAWDPVENASFLPWLTATAYLHSVMVQEQRGMLKVWNIVLSILTYLLTVFGTFLTRSGIVQSVHAFAETDVGWVFLAYLGILFLVSTLLILWRLPALKPDNHLNSYFSREAVFLFNNMLFISICFATLWGVLFPVFSEAIAGEKSVVGPPFFNRVNTPLFLALIFLMGVGPVIAWRRATLRQIRKAFTRPFIAGSVITALFLWIDSARVYSAIAFGLSVFVLATISAEIRRALQVQKSLSSGAGLPLAQLFRRKPRRYGGLLVHFGVAIMCIGITASSAYKIERDIPLRVGESSEIGPYSIRLNAMNERIEPNYDAIEAEIEVRHIGSDTIIKTMYPQRRAYRKSGELTTEVALRTTLRDDLYIALTGIDFQGEAEGKLEEMPAIFKVFVNPLQIWLWFGSVFLLLGALIVLIPGMEARYKASVASRAQLVRS